MSEGKHTEQSAPIKGPFSVEMVDGYKYVVRIPDDEDVMKRMVSDLEFSIRWGAPFIVTLSHGETAIIQPRNIRAVLLNERWTAHLKP